MGQQCNYKLITAVITYLYLKTNIFSILKQYGSICFVVFFSFFCSSVLPECWSINQKERQLHDVHSS